MAQQAPLKATQGMTHTRSVLIVAQIVHCCLRYECIPQMRSQRPLYKRIETDLCLLWQLYLPSSQLHAPEQVSRSLSTPGKLAQQMADLPFKERVLVAWNMLMGCIMMMLTMPCMVLCPRWDCAALRWIKERVKKQDGAGSFLESHDALHSQ